MILCPVFFLSCLADESGNREVLRWKKYFEFLISFPDDKAHRVIFGLKRVFFSKYEVHIGFNMCDVPFSPNKFCFCNIQHFFSSSTLLEFEVQIDKSWGFEICLRKIVKDAIVVTRFFFWGISSNASQKQAEAVLYSSSIWLLKVHRTSEYKSASLCCCSWNRVF